jgi:hypothetical protein
LCRKGIEIGGAEAHIADMDSETTQLKRNRARVFTIAAALFLVGSVGPDLGDLFDRHDGNRGDRHRERIAIEIDRVDEASDRAAAMTERAAEIADRAARLAAAAADQAERNR